MLTLLRFLAAVGALAAGWAVIVHGLLVLVWLAWASIAGPVIGRLVIAQPPPLGPWMLWAAWVALGLSVTFVVYYLFVPLRHIAEQTMRNVAHEPVEQGHPLYEMVSAIANKMQMHMPLLYVAESNIPNAVAISGLWRSAIVLTTTLFERLDRDQLAWVIAHELAHLKHKDSYSGTFWIVAIQVLRIAWYLRYVLMRFFVEVANTTRIPVVTFSLLLFPLLLINYAARLVDTVARYLFRLFDAVIGRAMEYRCDRIASQATHPNHGIAVLHKLNAGIEPDFGGVFATHPTTPLRIARLKYLATRKPDAAPVEQRELDS